jgi:hypothetical protein
MGTIVGAVAGQEEATCRVVDSMIRLQAGEFRTSGPPGYRYGSFHEARQLALDVLRGVNPKESRLALRKYFLEALRLQPQGEVLLRKCARDGSRIAGGRPLGAGTLVFASHGSAMKDVPEPDAFILDRPREHYLHYGWNRHTCLGQYVSPVIIVETMIALLGLQNLDRPEPRAGEASFPFERRFWPAAARRSEPTRRPSHCSSRTPARRSSSGRDCLLLTSRAFHDDCVDQKTVLSVALCSFVVTACEIAPRPGT